MVFGNELGFTPQGNYSLDDWGPRRRGEWPGTKIDLQRNNWKFPSDYSRPHIKRLVKKYSGSLRELQRKMKPQLPEDQLSHVKIEKENASHQQQMCYGAFPLCKYWIEEIMGQRDNKDFCWKLCAIYMASPEDTETKQTFGGELYDYLDSICFKGEQTWVFCESFLAKTIHCYPEQARDILGLINSHIQICNKVSNWCPGCAPLCAEECREIGVLCTEWRPKDYLLLPIFQRLFVIIDDIPTSGPSRFNLDFPRAKGRMVFIQDGRTADPVNVPSLCTKYSVYPTDNPNVVMGELDALLEVVVSLWEQEKAQLTYLDSIVGKLQERVKFKVQDFKIQRQEHLG